jgi:hypothetical protein
VKFNSIKTLVLNRKLMEAGWSYYLHTDTPNDGVLRGAERALEGVALGSHLVAMAVAQVCTHALMVGGDVVGHLHRSRIESGVRVMSTYAVQSNHALVSTKTDMLTKLFLQVVHRHKSSQRLFFRLVDAFK